MPHSRSKTPRRFDKRQFLVWGAAIVGISGLPLAVAQNPNSSPYPQTNLQPNSNPALLQDEVWTDSARSRDLPILVRWPVASALGVILFSHGMGGSRTGADVWGQAWAAAGFCVVHLQHPGSDAPALRGGMAALTKAMGPEQLPVRVADARFVMDEIGCRHDQKLPRWADLPIKKMGFAGHSYGARTAQALAGQAYPNGGGWQGTDARIKAFAMFSPALGKDTSLPQATQEALKMTRPTLLITGTLDGEVLGNGETPESRRMVFDSLPAGQKSLLLLSGADHMTFAGVAKTIPSSFLLKRAASTLQAEPQHHALSAQITTQWWLAQLAGAAIPEPSGLDSNDVWLKG